MKDPSAREIVNEFAVRYFEEGDRTWHNTYWLGTRVLKLPLDLWMYQELLFRERPDVIIESGTFSGGSALYLASICDLIGAGRVVTPRLTWIPIELIFRGSGVQTPVRPSRVIVSTP